MLIVETEKSLDFPKTLWFTQKVDLKLQSEPFFDDCTIKADHDIEAITCWLNRYQETFKTYDCYRREALRFSLWLTAEGLTLNQMTAQDLERYVEFLQNPPESWCASRGVLRQGLGSAHWRPFISGLSRESIRITLQALNSLFQYLVDGLYLKTNPCRLLGSNLLKHEANKSKYQAWARMLSDDEWEAVEETLDELPDETLKDIKIKYAHQLLFGLLYFLGLRINELATHSWGSFQLRDGAWWFFVKGKGGKAAHIPVHNKLLNLVKLYRISFSLSPLPETKEDILLMLSPRSGRPLSARQLYSMVKKIGKQASLKFEQGSTSHQKLESLSPHWLRHLSASHQDKAGMSSTFIRENMRHGSIQTTQIYLHAEDKARHAAIQKLNLNVKEPVVEIKQEAKKKQFKIILTDGPIDKALGLEKFVDAFEKKHLDGLKWSRGFDFSVMLQSMNESITPVKKIELSYFFTDLAGSEKEKIEKGLQFEARLRLFKLAVEVLPSP